MTREKIKRRPKASRDRGESGRPRPQSETNRRAAKAGRANIAVDFSPNTAIKGDRVLGNFLFFFFSRARTAPRLVISAKRNACAARIRGQMRQETACALSLSLSSLRFPLCLIKSDFDHTCIISQNLIRLINVAWN